MLKTAEQIADAVLEKIARGGFELNYNGQKVETPKPFKRSERQIMRQGRRAERQMGRAERSSNRLQSTKQRVSEATPGSFRSGVLGRREQRQQGRLQRRAGRVTGTMGRLQQNVGDFTNAVGQHLGNPSQTPSRGYSIPRQQRR